MNIVTVCTIKDKNKFGRGVAVCSREDEPNDEDGKMYAERYALHAIKGRKNIRITDERAIRGILITDCPFVYHTQIWPQLTWHEKRYLMKGKYL